MVSGLPRRPMDIHVYAESRQQTCKLHVSCNGEHFCRPRTKYDGRLCFYRCLSVNGGGEGGGGVALPLVLPGGEGVALSQDRATPFPRAVSLLR